MYVCVCVSLCLSCQHALGGHLLCTRRSLCLGVRGQRLEQRPQPCAHGEVRAVRPDPLELLLAEVCSRAAALVLHRPNEEASGIEHVL
jgi:hypothetical protein